MEKKQPKHEQPTVARQTAPKTAKTKGENKAKTGGSAASGDEIISQGYALFEEFRSAYAQEWSRMDRCEELYRADHWDSMNTDEGDPKPTTPVLHSTIENIAADVMDKYPDAIIRPESQEDNEIAKVVSALIAQNHDSMGFRREYKNMVHDLLVDGFCVQEVGYDARANSAIGQAFIRYVDCRNILFDPQGENIQEGRGVFKITAKPLDWFEKRYPEYEGEFQQDSYELVEDSVVKFDKTKSLLLIEYWWREYDDASERWLVHMVKMAGRKLLEDSREEKPEGYFSFGEYPFICTPLFRRKGSPLGWGLCDMFGSQQKYSDKLDSIVLKNAALASSMKILITESSGFKAEDIADWTKNVHVGQQINGVQYFANPPLPQYTVELSRMIRESIKEESGANEFSRGNVASGVTSAAAIAALQDMSSKRSRMISDQLHEAFKDAVRYEIEIEREYNVVPREVMLTNESGQRVTATFESAMLNRQTALGNEVPIEFFVSIKVDQESRWTVQAHNDLLIQLIEMGAIPPQLALEQMVFEGKDELLSKMNQQTQQAPSQADQATDEQAAQEEALMQELQGMPTPDQAVDPSQQQAMPEGMPQGMKQLPPEAIA